MKTILFSTFFIALLPFFTVAQNDKTLVLKYKSTVDVCSNEPQEDGNYINGTLEFLMEYSIKKENNLLNIDLLISDFEAKGLPSEKTPPEFEEMKDIKISYTQKSNGEIMTQDGFSELIKTAVQDRFNIPDSASTIFLKILAEQIIPSKQLQTPNKEWQTNYPLGNNAPTVTKTYKNKGFVENEYKINTQILVTSNKEPFETEIATGELFYDMNIPCITASKFWLKIPNNQFNANNIDITIEKKLIRK